MAKRKPLADALTIDTALADRTIARHQPRAGKPKAIKSDSEYLATAGLLREVKGHQKDLEKDRDEIIKPIRSGLDKLYEKFKAAKDHLGALEAAYKAVMEAYENRKTAKAIKAAEKKAAKAPNKEMAADIVNDAASRTHTPKADGVSYRTVWQFEIVNAKKVPVEWNGIELRPIDESALRKIATSLKGGAIIPGVKISAVKKVSSKAS